MHNIAVSAKKLVEETEGYRRAHFVTGMVYLVVMILLGTATFYLRSTDKELREVTRQLLEKQPGR